ncbi:putative cob(I)yrinic acid a,c-diamide adenosyltransferase [Prevotella disiens JCM 6334 = ATCC 29426]|uniref:corrinoid adenosyltransferase n=2 Tax=Prevotella disiens TaxID=28130 RepID=A0A379EG67_9BACT|nr:cob(I)yrinic acid a,c-diamide adenosyltransferase [Prevotella disiens]ERJ71821.1 putative cob(I)yrinic acid a,c-diamide adenosyltransferase [Prevotella disiens JCM 6334 = ATCC 29426]SUB97643.1 Cob(I)yrinic acid a,c-diamide adenosyltransferase [Prevotella disiens]
MITRKTADCGQIHIYTGNGKGKTTAAVGVAIRACMAGMQVFVGQFIKQMKYNETLVVNYINNLTVKQYGCGCMIMRVPNEEDKESAQNGLAECAKILREGKYDVVILDEITIALYMELVSLEQIMEALENRNKNVEVIITGRYCPQSLIDYADLVTEMKEIKHYYNTKGLLSRDGIDH